MKKLKTILSITLLCLSTNSAATGSKTGDPIMDTGGRKGDPVQSFSLSNYIIELLNLNNAARK